MRTPLPDTATNQVLLPDAPGDGPSAKIGVTLDRSRSAAVRRSTDFFIDGRTA
jgi:hypothetical protein